MEPLSIEPLLVGEAALVSEAAFMVGELRLLPNLLIVFDQEDFVSL